MNEKSITFHSPYSNYFEVPNEWINLSSQIESLSELKIVMYIIRHAKKVRAITTDEFTNGIKRRRGSRIDSGTGLSKINVYDGLKRAIDHGFVIQYIKDSDELPKTVYSYKLRMKKDEDEDENFSIVDKEKENTRKIDFKFSRKTVFERDKYRCQYCESWIDLTVDHIIPKAKGGSNKEDNLQTLCRSCNSKKGVKI